MPPTPLSLLASGWSYSLCERLRAVWDEADRGIGFPALIIGENFIHPAYSPSLSPNLMDRGFNDGSVTDIKDQQRWTFHVLLKVMEKAAKG